VIENGETYTVDVDFHDATKRPFHFTETVKYTMGALNHNGCVLASVSTPTENSQVYFRQMDSWTSRNEWTVVMSDGESVVCVGVCGHGVVVATDYQYLRIFSPSGMQTGIKSMPGPVVTICGYDSMLLVVYHIGGMYHQNASMGYQLIDMSTMKTIKTDVLCISPTTTLEWVGFTESGVPLTFDSAGVLRGLFVHSDAMWTPLFDSRLFRKTSSDWYFPVGATDSVMYCVVCRGDKVPSFPKPIIIDVPLSIPFCGLESERTVKEQKLLHHRLFLNEYRNDRDQQVELTAQRELEMDKIILPLFLAACKGQLSQRALELSFDLSNLKSLDGAIRVASNNHLQALTERLMTLKEVRLRELEDDDVSRVFEFKKEPVVEYEYTKTQEFEPVEPKRRKNPIAFKDDDDIIEQETPKVETVEKPVDEKKKKRNPFGTTKKEVVTVEANSCFDLIEPETNPVAEKVLEKKRKQTTLFDMVKQPVIVSFVNKDKKVKVVPVGYGISSSKETQEQQSILDHFSKDASQPMDADVDSEVKEVVVGKGKGIADPSLSLASFQYNKKEV
jgi:hypothetical protein